MSIKISGGCLCGAVRYEGNTEPVVQGHCQCCDCQKASGAGHLSFMAVPEADITVNGALAFFDKPADSGNVVSRAFCKGCGSYVFARNAGMAGMLFLTAGCLDDPDQFEPAFAVYTSRASNWDRLDPSLTAFPEMPPQVPGQS